MTNMDALKLYQDSVLGYEVVEHRVRREMERFKAVVYFGNGTTLRISEVYVDGLLKKYSYYWLDEHNALLIGWDNNDHHSHIQTSPHHRHCEGRVEASQEQDFRAVLSYISERTSGKK
ncbi:MAG: DUF6516 family protein [bacterium]|nr:DUF6516 family protein [bacterium]